MNRTTAILVALAILLGHALAIHENAAGEIAPPFDTAYVAFRIARNFVHSGSFAWEPGIAGIDSYPSLAWIGVASIAERMYWSVNQFCQAVGMLAAFACVLTLGQFSPKRLAGVIAPLLFVVSGGVASSALSGTETSLLSLAIVFGFLAYERGWRLWLALALALATLCRPEGAVFTFVLLAIEIVRRLWELRRPPASPRPGLWWAFALPIGVTIAVGALRWQLTGHFFSAWGEYLSNPRPRVMREGASYVYDFGLASGNAPLFIFPLWYLARGALSGLGIRACLLTAAWTGMVLLSGGGALPYFEAMTPILAILLVAVQEAMRIALDSRRRGWPQVTWVLFALGIVGAALASKYPGDLGPLPLERLHRAWMTPRTLARFGYEELNGRQGLAEEILATERLREIGIFLRDGVDPTTTVLSPWPGAIGYLSRLRVVDPLGRTTPSPGQDRTRPWEGLPRADVAKALASRPEYIVPTIRFGRSPPTVQDIAIQWAKSLDMDPHERGRSIGIRSELISYELITVPVTSSQARARVFARNHFYLMRRKDLELAPRLRVEVEGRRFRIEVEHRSHEQLADLRVQLLDRKGALWSMQPDGRFERRPSLLARTYLMLYPTGERRIRLIDGALPDGVDAIELRAVLRNPSAIGESLFTATSDEVVVQIKND